MGRSAGECFEKLLKMQKPVDISLIMITIY